MYKKMEKGSGHRLNIELDLQSLFGRQGPRNSPLPLTWAHIRGRFWSAKIDDISICDPLYPSILYIFSGHYNPAGGPL